MYTSHGENVIIIIIIIVFIQRELVRRRPRARDKVDAWEILTKYIVKNNLSAL